jgi:cation transporter-like permease
MARYREGTGTALLVAIGSFSVFAILAWIVAVLLWVALSIYALVEMIGDGRPSDVAVLLIVVLLVGTLVTLAAVGLGFAGKRLTPGKRDRG